ncbi:hypothetical protein PENSPDRAFT_333995 [Peniophora sp. CONT]|nr:hypothetical protein PENSPDRAFT_333995 [Peniophora sp. CONT]
MYICLRRKCYCEYASRCDGLSGIGTDQRLLRLCRDRPGSGGLHRRWSSTTTTTTSRGAMYHRVLASLFTATCSTSPLDFLFGPFPGRLHLLYMVRRFDLGSCALCALRHLA